MVKRINFSDHINSVFAQNDTTYEEVKSLMSDLYTGELSDGMTKREAEDNLHGLVKSIYGLTSEKPSKREIARARRAHDRDFFDVIEEEVDWTVTTGLSEQEWFNTLTNYKNLAEGDENLFVNDTDDTILSIARMGKRHHDSILQRLPQGETYSVPTDLYGAAVGMHIDLYLLGREDWGKLINAITKSFIEMFQQIIFAELNNAASQLPVQTGFIETGALNAANRKKFNKVLQNVSVANGNAPVVIVGTMVALEELENLIKIEWIAASQKEDKAAMGRLGNYGRYQLVEIPQKFARNDVTTDIYDDTKLWFFASGDDKLVDFIDVGETLITEVNERYGDGGRIDDVASYEVQREAGCAARVGRYFGQWTITED